MGKETSISALTESALFAVVCAVLSLARIYLAPIGIILTFLCPVPLILVVVRNNLKSGILSLIVATLLVNFFSNPFDAFMFFVWFGSVGLIYGISIKKKLSAGKIILSGSIASFLGIVIFLGLSILFLHFNPLNKIIQQVNKLLEEMINYYKEIGIKEREIEALANLKVVFPKIIPFFIFLISLVLSYLYFLTTQFIFQRMNYYVPVLPPFKMWRLSFSFVWGFILGKILTFIKLNPHNFLFILGINLDFIFSFLFFLMGVSVIAFFMEKYNFPKILKLAGYLLSMIFGVIIYWVGVLDIFLNFRKIEREGRL